MLNRRVGVDCSASMTTSTRDRTEQLILVLAPGRDSRWPQTEYQVKYRVEQMSSHAIPIRALVVIANYTPGINEYTYRIIHRWLEYSHPTAAPHPRVLERNA